MKKINQGLRTKEPDWDVLGKLRNSVVKMLDILGIIVEKVVLNEEDKTIFQQWNLAKSQKDWGAADKYRNQLSEKGLL